MRLNVDTVIRSNIPEGYYLCPVMHDGHLIDVILPLSLPNPGIENENKYVRSV